MLKIVGSALAVVWVGWFVIVLANSGTPEGRAALGLFGDSFGMVSSLMAASAAGFAWRALVDERARNATLERSERQRNVDLTFFRMLETRRTLLGDVLFDDALRGLPAFQEMREELMAANPARMATAYEMAELSTRQTISHYFRFTYHMVRIVHENFKQPEAYEYVRILRAQATGAELFLIGVNAAVGRGNPKMLEFVNRYSFLHPLR